MCSHRHSLGVENWAVSLTAAGRSTRYLCGFASAIDGAWDGALEELHFSIMVPLMNGIHRLVLSV
jgi:hypothetical protein